MKTKKFLAIGTMAALVVGLVAVAASAQDRDSDCASAIAQAVRQAVNQQVRQAVVQAQVQAHAQLAQAITDRVSGALASTVTGEVAARVNSRVQAALARSLARQSVQSTPHVMINGDELTSLDETGWLGVTPEDVSADRAKELKLSSPRGVYLSDVEKDSPAEKAGLKSGDVITEFNGEKVESVVQFRRLVRETPAGRTISVIVWRDGRSQTLTATLGSAASQFNIHLDGDLPQVLRNFTYAPPNRELLVPSEPRAFSFTMPDMEGWGFGQGQGSGNNYVFRMSPTPALGISAESVSGQLGTYFGAPDGEGILVREVNSGSPADKGGLKAGDVIVKIDGDRVRTLNEMQSKLREKREAKTVQVTVMRRGSETTVTIEPTKPPTRPAAPRANGRPVSF